MNKNLEFTKAIRAQIKNSFYTSFPKYLYVQFGNFLIFHLSFLILFLLYCRQFFNRQFDTYLATTSLNVNVEFFIILLTLWRPSILINSLLAIRYGGEQNDEHGRNADRNLAGAYQFTQNRERNEAYIKVIANGFCWLSVRVHTVYTSYFDTELIRIYRHEVQILNPFIVSKKHTLME